MSRPKPGNFFKRDKTFWPIALGLVLLFAALEAYKSGWANGLLALVALALVGLPRMWLSEAILDVLYPERKQAREITKPEPPSQTR
jgi:hypothetical protein